MTNHFKTWILYYLSSPVFPHVHLPRGTTLKPIHSEVTSTRVVTDLLISHDGFCLVYINHHYPLQFQFSLARVYPRPWEQEFGIITIQSDFRYQILIIYLNFAWNLIHGKFARNLTTNGNLGNNVFAEKPDL